MEFLFTGAAEFEARGWGGLGEQARFDAFREAALPSSWGICAWNLRPDDAGGGWVFDAEITADSEDEALRAFGAFRESAMPGENFGIALYGLRPAPAADPSAGTRVP